MGSNNAIEKLNQIAISRGGSLISTEYLNTMTKLVWKCSSKHNWQAAPYSIKAGSWCPVCSSGRSERICRVFFEAMFGEKFPTKKPYFLQGLELDGFSERLRIAFEHHGAQHYKVCRRYSTTTQELMIRRLRDQKKRKLCKKRGVSLIEIPYVYTEKKLPTLREFIKMECHKQRIYIPNAEAEINLKDIYSPDKINELHNIAKSFGGKCLSSTYVGSKNKYLWRCSKGHEWEACLDPIKQGHWCPCCAGNAKLSIQDAQKLANSRSGKCISTVYINAQTKLTWQCNEGHRWLATYGNVKFGQWCPQCAVAMRAKKQRKYSISDMRSIAKKYSGSCLSKQYCGNKSKLKWQCKNGHEWEAMPDSIIYQGSWCAICYGNKKLTIELMRQYASARGGECISQKYVNNHTRLKWKCKKGHLFFAVAKKVKIGQWCPVCWDERRKNAK